MAEPTAFVLVHSPICGPDTWWPVADALRAAGARAVVPYLDADGSAPFWRSHTRCVVHGIAEELSGGVPLVLVAHSGAGQLLGVLGLVLRDVGYRVAAYILADAGLPPDNQSRLAQLEADAPERADELRRHLDAGGRYPTWNDAMMRSLVADEARRGQLLTGVRHLPYAFWTETIPSAPAWPDAPVGVLLFSGFFEPTARAAAKHQWPLRRLSANNHFLTLADENAVAEELLVLAEELGDVDDTNDPAR